MKMAETGALQTECDRAREKLQREWLIGIRLLTENDNDFEGKEFKDLFIKTLREFMSKLEALCDELCELNRKLSLATQGTEKQNAFEKQMNLDFEMMDLSMQISSSLDQLRLSLINIKLTDENSRRKDIGALCERINKMKLTIKEQKENLSQQNTENLETVKQNTRYSNTKEMANDINMEKGLKENGQYHSHPERRHTKTSSKAKNKTNRHTTYKSGLLPKQQETQKSRLRFIRKRGGRKYAHKKHASKRHQPDHLKSCKKIRPRQHCKFSRKPYRYRKMMEQRHSLQTRKIKNPMQRRSSIPISIFCIRERMDKPAGIPDPQEQPRRRNWKQKHRRKKKGRKKRTRTAK